MDRPIALDICCGLGGWASGLIDAGFHVIGVDIEDMFAALGEPKPEHFELVLADICNIRGADYAHVSLIVGSSPCQDFSYRAMPWKRAKAMHAPFLGMWLFWQQFRIQREICEAKGEHVPMVVENVRGAIPWVGRSGANYGSYHVWGDVPALMPIPSNNRLKGGQTNWRDYDKPGYVGDQLQDHFSGSKVPGFRFDGSGRSFQTASVEEVKGSEGYERTFTDGKPLGWKIPATSSKSPARKAASARIARIPFALSSWIGAVYMPRPEPHP